MAQEGSTQYAQSTTLSNLLNIQIGDDANIEEGLCKPEDENLFLLSSIAFLQKQLMKRLENHEVDAAGRLVNRNYSDLLIVESGEKFKRQKTFIRLTNLEKFDEVLKNEASLPQNTLSNTQLLPLPKKSKSPRTIMSSIFKPRSTTTIPSSLSVKKSYSVFNMFRRTSHHEDLTNFEFDTEKIEVLTEKEKNVEEEVQEEEEQPPPVLASTSLASMVKTSTTSTTGTTDEIDLGDSDSGSSNYTVQSKPLSEIEEEILRIIPKDSNLTIKKSINQKLRCSRSGTPVTTEDELSSSSEVSLVKQDDDFYEDPETGIKFKCMSCSNRRLKEQQSKLSVCIEEDTESEIDYNMQERARKYPFNCTDDVKALVSSEAIDLIINEVWGKLDGNVK